MAYEGMNDPHDELEFFKVNRMANCFSIVTYHHENKAYSSNLAHWDLCPR